MKKLKDITSSSTMSDKARKWRKIAVISFSIASVIVSPAFPFALPTIALNVATVVQMVGMATGLGAQTNTSKKN